MNKHTDDELVEMAKAGDGDAFGELMRRTGSASYKLALSILKNHHEAEDEVQNAYTNAWRHFTNFNREAKFSTWITRIVFNQCLMRLRQQRRASFLFLDDESSDGRTTKFELPDERRSPETQMGRAQIHHVLGTEIERMPTLLRNVLMLRDLKEVPIPEVARRLGITITAAKSRLSRARHELRIRLERHCGVMGPATLTS
jgi:RNA polymerase sigma-70 factor (ECF subfamily)